MASLLLALDYIKHLELSKFMFLKLNENQQLVNTPDFTFNYFLKPQRLES